MTFWFIIILLCVIAFMAMVIHSLVKELRIADTNASRWESIAQQRLHLYNSLLEKTYK